MSARGSSSRSGSNGRGAGVWSDVGCITAAIIAADGLHDLNYAHGFARFGREPTRNLRRSGPLEQTMSGGVRIGISGWTYGPWRGRFYPKGLPQKRELSYAAS